MKFHVHFPYLSCLSGDFHFAWECLRVIFNSVWGSERDKGSLCHLKNVANRKHADKGVKVFNNGDEFLSHVFQAHLLAAVMSYFKISSTDEELSVSPEDFQQWLQHQAKEIVIRTILPCDSSIDPEKDDHLYLLHRRILHLGFFYLNLRHSIRDENGPKIIAAWKYALILFLGSGRRNYATQAANFLCNLQADWSSSTAFIAIHNRTVNTSGIKGRGKPIDQQMEHYNL